MKYTTIFLFALFSFSLGACQSLKNGKPTIKQGIYGKITELKGNVMPSPDASRSNGAKGVVRTVCIYELATLSQTEGETPLFTTIHTKLVARVKTNKEGEFQCKLPEGRYSIFTEEIEGKLFANLFEDNGRITPFEVKLNQVTTYNVTINHKAFY